MNPPTPDVVKVNGLVNAGEVYQPTMVTIPFLRSWSLKCGNCGKDFVRFAINAKPKCPYCATRNFLNFTWYY